ncbi:hypothetical protein [Mangrovibacterium sp.]|uniref:hypothetical protein n=1 Tax=Mangrovibacterium sp. TaxID=1961364 RepID=UPI0035668DEC
MNRYLEQLIDDIRQASWRIQPPHELWLESNVDTDDEDEVEDMAYAEQFLYGEKKPISEITGIEREKLPSPELLRPEHQAVLAQELEKLLELFHFYLDFPEGFPLDMRYSFIRDLWSESHVPLSFGENQIEFCQYEEEDCPFPGYCTVCKEFEIELESEQAKGAVAGDMDFNVEDLLPTPEDIDEWVRNRQELLEDENELDGISKERARVLIDQDFRGGLFDDEGYPIDPESVPVPGLCVICKMYQIDDPEENLLCLMNRHDQRNDVHFKCGMFEKN